MADGTRPTETTEAKEAFAQYVALGPGRSLRLLARTLVTQELYKTEQSALTVVGRWSRQHNWQDRIGNAATERAERMLQEAAQLDADTFLKTSKKLNEQVKNTTEPGDIVRIRESVRRPVPKGGAAVSVNVSVEVRQLAEQLAKSMGITAEELIQDAEAIAAGAWGEP